MLTPQEVDDWADQLARARRARQVRDPITATTELTLHDAYAVQRAVTARRLTAGERIVGWKLGYTSAAMRAQMGIAQPNFGPLTDAMLLPTGAAVDDRVIQPRVEPEIGLRFTRAVRGEVDRDEVMAAVGEVVACLEVVDSVYRDYRFRLEDNTADGSSAALVVVGPHLTPEAELADVTVALSHNGAEVARATGAAASGDPAAGVVWLVGELARRGEGIRPGDLVITGGLTSAVPLGEGDEITARFDGSVEVSVRRPSGAAPG